MVNKDVIMLGCAARRVFVRNRVSLCARGGCAEHFAELCSTLQKIAVCRDAKYRFRTFALSLDDKRVSATLAERFVSALTSHSLARTLTSSKLLRSLRA